MKTKYFMGIGWIYRKAKRRRASFIVIFAMAIFFNIYLYNFAVTPADETQTMVSTDGLKSVFSGNFNRSNPKILLWTTFFGKMLWYEESKNVFSEICNSDCILTANRSEIETADAIVFHLNDITWGGHMGYVFGHPFPKYRRPDQVWILHNLEPITMVWGSFSAWQGLFNWTWSYPRGSDVYAPYGQMRRLTAEESANLRSPENVKNVLEYDYFRDKPKAAGITMISDCADESQRYRLIDKLRQYIDIDVFGGCGQACPDGYASCVDLLTPYKFYFALENSDCRDYVSEKYWRSLDRKQIPVVAWKLSMEGLVIPNSYINVNDFIDIDEAGTYIKTVSENRTLYNSYFKWKEEYTIDPHNGYCTLCEKLKDSNMPPQVYHDMNGWITSAGCPQATVSIIESSYEKKKTIWITNQAQKIGLYSRRSKLH